MVATVVAGSLLVGTSSVTTLGHTHVHPDPVGRRGHRNETGSLTTSHSSTLWVLRGVGESKGETHGSGRVHRKTPRRMGEILSDTPQRSSLEFVVPPSS